MKVMQKTQNFGPKVDLWSNIWPKSNWTLRLLFFSSSQSSICGFKSSSSSCSIPTCQAIITKFPWSIHAMPWPRLCPFSMPNFQQPCNNLATSVSGHTQLHRHAHINHLNARQCMKYTQDPNCHTIHQNCPYTSTT